MGANYGDPEAEFLTEILALGPRYFEAMKELSDYQRTVVAAHTYSVGAELNNCVVAELDARFRGVTPSHQHSLLWKLLTGQIDQATMIGEMSSLEVVRKWGIVIVDSLNWHTIH